jgi:hypothetical protein
MAQYRMYVVDKTGKFRWPYDLSAPGDADARSMAQAAQYMCADFPIAVELWHGARRVPGTSARGCPSRDHWERAYTAQPEALLRLTEALRNSGTAVARSRRLSVQMDASSSRQTPQLNA